MMTWRNAAELRLMRPGTEPDMKDSSELNELLALAIALEEEDNRTHGDIAGGLRETYPGTKMFAATAAEKNGHRLLDLYRQTRSVETTSR